jgi:ParB-like chromosome segregation protein Spo0J
MKTEKVKIGKIKTNPNNPRLIKDDKFKKLVKSIKEFPEMLEIRPIVVDKDNIVLGGNMRLRACQEAGLKEVYILQADQLTEKQQREFIIKDNVGFGEWDWDDLANEWDTEELEDWGLDLPVFKENEDELKDISDTIDNLYRIEIICKDEEHQENTYNKLIEQGHECRILTL